MPGRPLSKSRYRLGLECPTKIFYSLDPRTYANRNQDNDFLRALAEGGFQVGKLACCMHPEGEYVETLIQEDALLQTKQLLEKDTVTIFEAAFAAQDCFIRADIIRKSGKTIELIEVKSKSVEPDADGVFVGQRGGIKADWIPYLHDVAFQTFVIRAAMPGYEVRPFLMLADKSSVAPIEGLNGYFVLRNDERGRTSAHTTRPIPQEVIDEPVLRKMDVGALVDRILAENYDGLGFAERVAAWAAATKEGRKIDSPIAGSKCAGCEFRAGPEERAEGYRSGFHECWAAKTHLTEEDLDGPLVTEIWASRQKDTWTGAGIYRVRDLNPAQINATPTQPTSGWSRSERQAIQVKAVREGRTEPVVDVPGLRAELSRLKYPLHFIDFETTRSALPFHKDARPYGQVAFQFSHHLVTKDGEIRHAGEWICLERGKLPNADFARALRKELETDEGSVLHYAHHEKTVINELAREVDPDLSAWLRSLVSDPPGRMVDMQKILLHHYYHPLARGSNSLKAVLPAILRTSSKLQAKYAQPIYGTSQMPSCNFCDHVWVQMQNGVPTDPYCALEPLEGEVPGGRIFGDDQIKDGGGAMTAYARSQFTEMTQEEIDLIRPALLKYCELDTLAMVMLWEEWVAACAGEK
jgi:hypothetical protein